MAATHFCCSNYNLSRSIFFIYRIYTNNLSSLKASAFFNPPGNAITSYDYSRIYFVIYVSQINCMPDLPVTLGSSSVIGFIEAKVTSIPALRRTSIIATVSISSHPSPTGINKDLFIIILLRMQSLQLPNI